MKLPITTEIDVDDLFESLYSLEYDDVIKLILRMDRAMADVEFSEKLIKKLLVSLKPDADETTTLKCVDWSKVKSPKKDQK